MIIIVGIVWVGALEALFLWHIVKAHATGAQLRGLLLLVRGLLLLVDVFLCVELRHMSSQRIQLGLSCRDLAVLGLQLTQSAQDGQELRATFWHMVEARDSQISEDLLDWFRPVARALVERIQQLSLLVLDEK